MNFCHLLSKASIVLCTVLSATLVATAQEESSNFAQASVQELQFKECPFDKNADAVILLDQANANFNDQYNLVTERHIRLKILKESGIARGNIRIPYYSADGFESIGRIRAVVITPTSGGAYITSELERKNVFNRQINSLYSLISFALPNVKVGSVIDYSYESVMRSYAGLKHWNFQSDLPVLTSSYQLAPIPNSEFAYSVYKSPQYPIDITPDKANGKIRFVMKNIPGLRDEVYSASTEHFLQRVNFQFASYTNYQGKTNYTSTWEQLVRELLAERGFGSQLGKDLSGTPFLRSLSPSLSPTEKVKAIYNFVRTSITWNDITSKYSEDGVKNTLEKKKGNSGDINLLLLSLLKSAGLTAYPVLVSERERGLIDTTYSYLDQFNKVVALVDVGGSQYILDGTDRHSPFFMVPPDLLNTIGYLVDKNKKRFVYFNNLPHKQRELININGELTDEGLLKGQALVRHAEYAKLEKLSRFKTDKAKYREALLKPYAFVSVDSFELDGLNNDSMALTQKLNFHCTLKKAGGYYLLNANLLTGLSDNPFITQHRFTDIDFGAKYKETVVESFTVPPSLIIETLPPSKKLVSPDRSMSVSRFIEKKENQIDVRFDIEINREKYSAEEYEVVKAFFKEMVELLNEPVLLKSK